MTKRTAGTGSITRTPSGKFKGTIRVTIGNEQKRISKTFPTRKEVEKFFQEVSQSNIKYYSPTTISEYFEHFIQLKEGVYRESTLYGIRMFYRKHIQGSILDKTKFYTLDSTVINRFFLGLASHGYATSTLSRWRKEFKSILEMAVYEGYLEDNPMNSPRSIKKIKGKPSRNITTFTLEEVQKLLSFDNLSRIPLVYQMYIVIAFLTGGRPQEILALTKGDIQIDNVTFNKSLGLRGKLQKDCLMKTPWSNRTVPIPKMYGQWLVEKIKKAALPEDSLFHSSKSAYGYLDRDNVGCRFKKYVKDVLIENHLQHRLYDTRHTYATLLITVLKVDVKTVSKLMGHNNIETTLRYYTHPMSNNVPCNLVLPVGDKSVKQVSKVFR